MLNAGADTDIQSFHEIPEIFTNSYIACCAVFATMPFSNNYILRLAINLKASDLPFLTQHIMIFLSIKIRFIH
ncbi:MAG: hypothetical protein QG673_1503 [Pseudomonadota bacterium]|nr:hypothetical protein [Pseudomonadota bacterium]